MIIKRLQTKDLDNVLQLIHKFKNPEAGHDAIESFLLHDDHYLIAAFENDNPAGYVIAYELRRTDTDRPMIYIHDVEVGVEYRRQGLGRSMLEHLHQIGREREALKMFVITGADNEAAMKLYQAAGGKQLADSDAVFEFRF